MAIGGYGFQEHLKQPKNFMISFFIFIEDLGINIFVRCHFSVLYCEVGN